MKKTEGNGKKLWRDAAVAGAVYFFAVLILSYLFIFQTWAQSLRYSAVITLVFAVLYLFLNKFVRKNAMTEKKKTFYAVIFSAASIFGFLCGIVAGLDSLKQ